MKFKLILDQNAEEEIIVIANKESELTKQIENLVHNFTTNYHIIGYKDDEIRKLSLEEIECITILDRKVFNVDHKQNYYRIQERLRDLENILPSYFIIINKSTIANETCVLRFETSIGGGVDAIFKCGYRDYVSRRCFVEIKRRYEE